MAVVMGMQIFPSSLFPQSCSLNAKAISTIDFPASRLNAVAQRPLEGYIYICTRYTSQPILHLKAERKRYNVSWAWWMQIGRIASHQNNSCAGRWHFFHPRHFSSPITTHGIKPGEAFWWLLQVPAALSTTQLQTVPPTCLLLPIPWSPGFIHGLK